MSYIFQNLQFSSQTGGVFASQDGSSMVSQFGQGFGSNMQSFSVLSHSDGDKVVHHIITDNNGEKTEKEIVENLH